MQFYRGGVKTPRLCRPVMGQLLRERAKRPESLSLLGRVLEGRDWCAS